MVFLLDPVFIVLELGQILTNDLSGQRKTRQKTRFFVASKIDAHGF